MGGGREFAYPKWVWSPTGGWWHQPKNGNRNAFIAATVFISGSLLLANYIDKNYTTTYYVPRIKAEPGHGHNHH